MSLYTHIQDTQKHNRLHYIIIYPNNYSMNNNNKYNIVCGVIGVSTTLYIIHKLMHKLCYDNKRLTKNNNNDKNKKLIKCNKNKPLSKHMTTDNYIIFYDVILDFGIRTAKRYHDVTEIRYRPRQIEDILITLPNDLRTSKHICMDLSHYRLFNYKITSFPNNLIKLNISRSRLNDMSNNLPSSLKYLDCSHNIITDIKDLPNNLLILKCNHNHIKRINKLPESLEYIDISHNRIETIENLPSVLRTMNISYNCIKEIKQLPQMITNINCSNNNITYLPEVLSQSLIYLDCSHNRIINLPTNMVHIEELYCNNNRIINIPKELPNIRRLDISRNKITNFNIDLDIDKPRTIDSIKMGINNIGYLRPCLWKYRHIIQCGRKVRKFRRGSIMVFREWRKKRKDKLFMSRLLMTNQLHNKHNISYDVCKIVSLYIT